MLCKTIRQYASIKVLILMPIRWSSVKRYARTWQENIKNSLFLELKLEGFSTDKDKIEFCKVLQRESKGIKKSIINFLEK